MPKNKKAGKNQITKRSATKTQASPTQPAAVQPAAVEIATRALASLQPISDITRNAYLGQTTVAQRTELGARTRAKDVLVCAGEWIPIIQHALPKYGIAIRYPVNRLAYLCELTLHLAETMDASRGGQKQSITASARITSVRATARHVRSELIDALQDVTAGSEDAATVAAIARQDADFDLGKALGELAALAADYLKRAKEDEAVHALVNGVLAEADVTAATSAAKALSAAGVDKSDAGTARSNDSPEVNEVEGAVTAELRVARRAFERAHRQNASIPRLIPTAPLRSVLLGHPRSAAPAPAPPKTPVSAGQKPLS